MSGKFELGRLPSCSYYPEAPDWQCKPCVDLRHAMLVWTRRQKTRADGWPKFQSDYGRRFQCTRPATRLPLPKVSVRWGSLPEQAEVVTNPIVLCEPCSPGRNTSPPCKKRRVGCWQEKWKASHEEAMNNAAKEHNVEVETLSKELEVAQEKLKRTVTQMETLKKRIFRNLVSEIGSISNSIEMVLQYSMPNCKQQAKLTALLDIVFNNELFNGKHEDIISKRVKARSKALFDAWRVLKCIDQIGGGSFNYKCCDTARKSQTDIKKHERGIFPSSSAVQSRAKALNDHAQQIIPFKRGTSNYGEYIEFDPIEKFLRILLDGFHLTNLALLDGSDVEIAITLDGAKLSRNLSHVTAGIKIVNKRACDPMTGAPLFVASDGCTNQSVQSREFCFPIKILLAPDSKDLYKNEFAKFFKFFEDIGKNGLAASEHGPALKPFKIVSPQDMSSFWKSLGSGGAAKCKTLFCHCCMCKSADMTCFRENENRCHHCKDTSNDYCYHHDMMVNEVLEKYKQELISDVGANFEPHFARYDAVAAKSKVITDPTIIGKMTNPHHIDYNVLTPSSRNAFGSFLLSELQIRSLDILGSVEVRRTRLREVCKVEDRLRVIRDALVRDNLTREGMMILLEQAIPCVLHLENRVGEKIVTMLLREVVACHSSMSTAAVATLVKAIEKSINTTVLGTLEQPSQWRIDFDERTKTIGDVSLTNSRARKLVAGLPLIVDQYITDDWRKVMWNSALVHYEEAVAGLRSRKDFTDEDVTVWQQGVDFFYTIWVDLHGMDGLTNYIHMLGVGHVGYYLRLYKNLYRYSQQGWEAMNDKIKTFYFRRTQRGGHANGPNAVQSHLDALGKFFQRSVLWSFGKGDAYFLGLQVVNENA